MLKDLDIDFESDPALIKERIEQLFKRRKEAGGVTDEADFFAGAMSALTAVFAGTSDKLPKQAPVSWWIDITRGQSPLGGDLVKPPRVVVRTSNGRFDCLVTDSNTLEYVVKDSKQMMPEWQAKSELDPDHVRDMFDIV